MLADLYETIQTEVILNLCLLDMPLHVHLPVFSLSTSKVLITQAVNENVENYIAEFLHGEALCYFFSAFAK